MSESRRKFLNIAIGGGLLGWLASVLYPVGKYLNPPEVPEANVASVKVGPIGDFPQNSSRIVKFGRRPVLVIRTDTGELRAFNATCTHLDCTVQYRDDKKDIWCACHNGIYDLSGRNLSGPPPRPLDDYVVNIVEGEIVVAQKPA